MNERERILALVRDNIITTEEALELLENLAKKETREAADINQENAFKQEQTPEAGSFEEETVQPETTAEEAAQKDRENLEKILEELASEISYFSARVDEKNEAMRQLENQLAEKKEKRQELRTTEEMGGLSVEEQMVAVRLEEEIGALESQLASLSEESREMEEKMRSLKKEQVETNVKKFSEKFGNKEDWKEAANDVTEKLTTLGSQVSRFVSKTIQTVSENVDWKEFNFNLNVPGVVTSKFQHDFLYENATASILDFQVANGDVIFQTWEKEDILVKADIKIYGRTEEATPMKAFEVRSDIQIDEDKLTFKVPNKRIRSDLTVFLPQREYDYASLKLLNGNVKIDDLNGKDFYIKSTNGSMTFNRLKATMLETDAVNGDVSILDSKAEDVIAKTINGSIITRSEIVSANVSVVNGDAKLTYTSPVVSHIQASNVNGSIKLSLPADISVEVEATTSLGQIKNRMEAIEVIQEKNETTNKYLELRRLKEAKPLKIKLKTITGSIYLKENRV